LPGLPDYPGNKNQSQILDASFARDQTLLLRLLRCAFHSFFWDDGVPTDPARYPVGHQVILAGSLITQHYKGLLNNFYSLIGHQGISIH
jgi:hypothetical protein